MATEYIQFQQSGKINLKLAHHRIRIANLSLRIHEKNSIKLLSDRLQMFFISLDLVYNSNTFIA